MKLMSKSNMRRGLGLIGLAFVAGAMGGSEPAPASDSHTDVGTIRGVVKDRLVRRNAAAVYIEKIPGKVFPPPQKHAVMDQKDLKFVPHVLPILVGTTVDFPNSDNVRHSVFTSKKSVTKFNLGTYGVGVVKKVVLDAPGVTTLLCNVHAEMVAYLVAVETPYFAVTDRRGTFSIEAVPAGSYDLTIWHEQLEEKTVKVTVEPGQTTDVELTGLKMR
jgi:plastocyanin